MTGIGKGTNLCWTRPGVRSPPITNPGIVLKAPFINSDAATLKTERVRLLDRSSVLDALCESANALDTQLNTADRNQRDQYLTSVREVEKQLQMSKEWLDRPKPQASTQTAVDQECKHVEGIPLMQELLTLALRTDSTRKAHEPVQYCSQCFFQKQTKRSQPWPALGTHGVRQSVGWSQSG